MTRAKVQRRLAAYLTAQENLADRREALRREVIAWKSEGATIVAIAEALGWSRQSVYDLIGKST